MKDLELIIYPKRDDHHGNPTYVDPASGELYLTEWTAEQDAEWKRFTDSELAAEYWAAEAAMDHPRITGALYRFAHLRHAG